MNELHVELIWIFMSLELSGSHFVDQIILTIAKKKTKKNMETCGLALTGGLRTLLLIL